MAKGRRQLDALSSALDLLLEVRDARAPRLTASPTADLFPKSLSLWVVLSKADLASLDETAEWERYFKEQGRRTWSLDLRKGAPRALKRAIGEMRPTSSSRTIYREVRIAVVGTPNVGKSMLLNSLVGRKAAAVGGVPGVTKGVAWFKGEGCLVADSPGILDPHSDARAHRMLSWISSTRGQVIGAWTNHACECIAFLQRHGLISGMAETWGIDVGGMPADVLERAGRRLGRLKPGGLVDLETSGKAVIEALASGKLGRMSLESPDSPPPWNELQ
jgi:ribosome biogenesis GTPase A